MERHEADVMTVFLVDDHDVVCRGLADLLDAESDLRVVGQAGTVGEALKRIPAARPDVAVLDVRLPDGSGVELCRELRSGYPDLACLMLTSYSDEKAMLDAILAGAAGYALKDIRGVDLAEAVRTVGSGRSMLDNRAAAVLMDRLRADVDADGPLSNLTERERTLLDLISEGLTNRQIGSRMFLAEKTVKNYVSRLLRKLGLHSRTQAALLFATTRANDTSDRD